MAVVKTVRRTDDFGSAGEATQVRFSVEGRDYAIDLNKRNRETFLRRIAPYIEHGLSLDESRNPAAIRAWAVENGYNVTDRGRIPYGVEQAYEEHLATLSAA